MRGERETGLSFIADGRERPHLVLDDAPKVLERRVRRGLAASDWPDDHLKVLLGRLGQCCFRRLESYRASLVPAGCRCNLVLDGIQLAELLLALLQFRMLRELWDLVETLLVEARHLPRYLFLDQIRQNIL